MRRITVTEVLQAYASTGLEPANGLWRRGNKACALTAIFHSQHGWSVEADDFENQKFSTHAANTITNGLDLDDLYRAGFTYGFDKQVGPVPRSYSDNYPLIAAGIADGRAAAISVGLQ